jgi:hypothetical protein
MNYTYSSKNRPFINNSQSGNFTSGKSLPSVPVLQTKKPAEKLVITGERLPVQGKFDPQTQNDTPSQTAQLKPFELPVQKKEDGNEPVQKSFELKSASTSANVRQFWPPGVDSDDEQYDEDISADEKEDDDDEYTETEAKVSNRTQYGYVNPTHDSKLGVQILAAGAHTPNNGSRPDSVHYLSPSRNFYTSSPTRQTDGSRRKDPGLTQGHQNVVFGHDEGASEHFNRVGHQQSPRTNRKWNNRRETFHGLEQRAKSNKSGGSSARYREPARKWGSYEPYYKNTPRRRLDLTGF